MTAGIDWFLHRLHCDVTGGLTGRPTVYMRPWKEGDATRGIRGMVLVVEREDVL